MTSSSKAEAAARDLTELARQYWDAMREARDIVLAESEEAPFDPMTAMDEPRELRGRIERQAQQLIGGSAKFAIAHYAAIYLDEYTPGCLTWNYPDNPPVAETQRGGA